MKSGCTFTKKRISKLQNQRLPKTSKGFKKEISTFSKGGYYYLDYIAHIKEAIANAKEADSDRNHFFPKEKETKVYQLVEAIIAKATIKEFDDFLQKLQ